MVTSVETDDYNCAAWALGDDQRQVWPLPPGAPTNRTYHWPPSARREETVDAAIEGLAEYGFEECPHATLEEGYAKVAIYATAAGKLTHFARQLANGVWTSKLGDLEDIVHATLADVECTDYGQVRAYVRMPRSSG